jgi:hypothetical protein
LHVDESCPSGDGLRAETCKGYTIWINKLHVYVTLDGPQPYTCQYLFVSLSSSRGEKNAIETTTEVIFLYICTAAVTLRILEIVMRVKNAIFWD